MIGDYVKFALGSIARRRLRSWLTMIGIFIGITAVVALISLGQGLSDTIDREFAKVGGNRVMVLPGGGEGFAALGGIGGMSSAKLTEKDVEVVRNTRGIARVLGVLRQAGEVKFKGERAYTQIFCVPTDKNAHEFFDKIDYFMVEEGRYLKGGDRFKALIGKTMTKDFFDNPVYREDKIDVEGYVFEVVGVNKKTGNPVHDKKLTIPIDLCREIFNVTEDEVTVISSEVKEGFAPSKVAEEVERRLRRSRGVKEGEEDFNVQTAEELMRTFTQVIDVVQIVITGIAAISLIVGGIGIMNTMYASVIERTREIGVMKAVGAREKDIMKLFLIEAGLLGLVGGIIGVILGLSIGKIVESYAVTHGLEMLRIHVSVWFIGSVLAFSFVVGSLSGALPARAAARLQPVEALRK